MGLNLGLKPRLRRTLQPLLARAEHYASDALMIRTGDPLSAQFAEFGQRSAIEWPRVALVNPSGVAIGDDVYLRAHLCVEALSPPGKVVVRFGNRIEVGYYCRFVGVNGITIGDDVGIGHGVTISDTVHRFKDEAASGWKAPLRLGDPIHLGDGCWLGNNSIITGGITIGERAITAANSFINRSVPPETVVGGAPAHVWRYKRNGQWHWLIDPDKLDLETQVAIEERLE